MANFFEYTIIVSLFVGMLRTAMPIVYAAMGELVAERAGILNLGLEGMILLGAFVGFMVAYFSGSLWLGVAAAVLAGALLGAFIAFVVATLRVDQIMAGLAINLLIGGLTSFGFRLAFRTMGGENPAVISTFGVFKIPLLSQIPFFGEVLFSQHALTYIGLLLVPVISVFLYRTRYGLELRAVGDNPRAVDMKGVSVTLRQYLALMFAGALAAIGGDFLCLASTGIFVPLISNGRGWLAIALVIFGNWRPRWILFGALFFGLIDSVQLSLQTLGVSLPYQLLLASPYLLTIMALVVYRSRSHRPLWLGVPYYRETR